MKLYAENPTPDISRSNKVPDRLALAIRTACYIRGGDADDRARALEVDGGVLLALANTESPETVQTLSSQLQVLEALFLSLAKDSVVCKSPRDRVRLMKAALAAQASYARTVALIAKLKKQTNSWDILDI